MAYYQEHQPEKWKGRNDGEHADVLRWHQVVKQMNWDAGASESFAVLGFECDEGVRRNRGRIGAAKGPEAIIRALSNLPSRLDRSLFDAGNILCDKEDLEGAQRLLATYVAKILGANATPLVLGGGHEVSLGHFMGIRQAHPGKKIGILNIDAHFDLRPLEAGKGSSGTPFRQIHALTEEDGTGFHYRVVGIQRHGNTTALFKTAEELGAGYYTDTEFDSDGDRVTREICAFAGTVDLLYLTVCMDAFNVAYAPGVSAVNVRGLHPNASFFRFLEGVAATGKVVAIDIAEVNPLYDEGDRTSRLAALILFEMTRMLEGQRTRR